MTAGPVKIIIVFKKQIGNFKSSFYGVPIKILAYVWSLPLQDLNNKLQKMNDEIADRESALEQRYQELLDQTKRRLQTHEVTIQQLKSTLSDKEQQLQVTQH